MIWHVSHTYNRIGRNPNPKKKEAKREEGRGKREEGSVREKETQKNRVMSKNVLNRKKKIQQAEEADDLSSTSSEGTIENKLPRPKDFIYAPSTNLTETNEEGKVRRRKRSSTSLLFNNDAEVVNTRRVKNRFLNIPIMEENKFIKPKCKL